MKKISITGILLSLLLMTGFGTSAEQSVLSYTTEAGVLSFTLWPEPVSLPASARASLVVLRSDDGFPEHENAGNDDSVVFVYGLNGAKMGKRQTVSFDVGEEVGEYLAKLTVTVPGTEPVTTIEYVHYDPYIAQTCAEEFANTDAEDFDALVAKYAGFNVIDPSEIIGYSSSGFPTDFADYFVKAREGYKKGLYSDRFTSLKSVENVMDCMKTAALLRGCESGENVTELCNAYGDLLDKSFGENPPYDVFAELYVNSESETQKMADELKYFMILARLQNASYDTAEEILSEYADFLEIDTEYLKKKGLTLGDVCRYLDVEFAKGEKVDFAQQLKDIADEHAVKSTGSKSSGGGSGGTKSAVLSAVPDNLPDSNAAVQDGETKELFHDLQNYDWAVNSISELYEKHVINGTGDGAFQPERTVTRAEFLKMVVSACNLATGEQHELSFTDCPIEAWYYPYVNTAYQLGIVQGMSEEMFGADREIAREDMAVICYKIMQQKGVSFSTVEQNFTDEDTIAGYATEAVRATASGGIVTGYPDGCFGPHKTATRAEAAVITARLMRFIAEGVTE